MAKYFKQNCKECGRYYEGWGKYFCSLSCSNRNHTRGREIAWKDKISETLKGRRLKRQHIANIRKALKGREIKQAHRDKLSIAARENWKDVNFKTRHLRKHCNKCGCFVSNNGKHQCPLSVWNKGLDGWTVGTKAGFQKGHKINLGRKWINRRNVGKPPLLTKEQYRQNGLKGLMKQQNSKEPTSIEKKVYEELKNRGFLFETQRLINGKFIVDAYIPSLNLIIEVDGDYWHSLDKVRKKDRAENAYLKKCGFKLLRLSEFEINNGEFIKKIERMVN